MQRLPLKSARPGPRWLAAAVLMTAAASVSAGPAGLLPSVALDKLLPGVAGDRLAQSNLIPRLGDDRSRSRPDKTPAEAAREARERYGGKVLAVNRDGDGYRVKLIKQGNVRVVRID
ncbi:MAG: hypothetical protein RLO53_13105 [Salinisphaeraceae bacterium]